MQNRAGSQHSMYKLHRLNNEDGWLQVLVLAGQCQMYNVTAVS